MAFALLVSGIILSGLVIPGVFIPLITTVSLACLAGFAIQKHSEYRQLKLDKKHNTKPTKELPYNNIKQNKDEMSTSQNNIDYLLKSQIKRDDNSTLSKEENENQKNRNKNIETVNEKIDSRIEKINKQIKDCGIFDGKKKKKLEMEKREYENEINRLTLEQPEEKIKKIDYALNQLGNEMKGLEESLKEKNVIQKLFASEPREIEKINNKIKLLEESKKGLEKIIKIKEETNVKKGAENIKSKVNDKGGNKFENILTKNGVTLPQSNNNSFVHRNGNSLSRGDSLNKNVAQR